MFCNNHSTCLVLQDILHYLWLNNSWSRITWKSLKESKLRVYIHQEQEKKTAEMISLATLHHKYKGSSCSPTTSKKWGGEYVIERRMHSHPALSDLHVGIGWVASQDQLQAFSAKLIIACYFLFFLFGTVGSNCVGFLGKRPKIVLRWCTSAIINLGSPLPQWESHCQRVERQIRQPIEVARAATFYFPLL